MAETRINAKTFRHTKRPVRRALELKYRLVSFFAADMGDLPALLGGAGSRRDGETAEAHAAREAASNGALIKMLVGALRDNEADAFLDLVSEFLETDEAVQVKHKGGDWHDVSLDGDLDEADFIPLMAFVLREEFGAFFGGLPKLKALREMGSA